MPKRGKRPNDTLTAVPGVEVGHATNLEGITGCTVIYFPLGARAAVDQRGGAPGTRETDLLRPGRLVQMANAILLTGGSTFGLAAAQGVVEWLEERGEGFKTGAGPVPIVPAAVLYDLEVGDAKARPDAPMGRAACEAISSAPVNQGSVGAGAGCRVGALFGTTRAMKGGIGSAAVRLPGPGVSDDLVVAALIAVNALGDVVDETGHVIAGLRRSSRSRRLCSTLDVMLERGAALAQHAGNTVIGVIATNAGSMSHDGLTLVASMAHDGIARAVHPSHTLHDGDTIFATATGHSAITDPSLIGAMAAEATARAIRNAVRSAKSLGGLPSARNPRVR